jgi:23S rRNA pseudouridine1911/1915/1917 synthase
VSVEFSDRKYSLPANAPPKQLGRVLRELHPDASWNAIRRLVTTGKVSINDRIIRDPAATVASGDLLSIRMNAPKAQPSRELRKAAIVHVDAQLVVVDKPSGVSTVAFDDSERDSLDQLVARTLGGHQRPLGIVHRLDKETSGLLVFARTLSAKRELKQQFRFHTIHRRYQALVHGEVSAHTLHSRLVRDRGDGLRGSTDNPKLGKPSTTHVQPLERLRGATLIECTLETGRTHQIRIHLSEAGHPVVGERVYIRDFDAQPISAPRLMLHAAELGLAHPVTGQTLRFSSPLPADFRALLAALRAQPPAKPRPSARSK